MVKAPSANLPAMLVCQLLPYTKNLATRKWSDEDIIEDIKFLKDELTTRFESLTYVIHFRHWCGNNQHFPTGLTMSILLN